jgi:uncharacterized protein (TIGR02284 family)
MSDHDISVLNSLTTTTLDSVKGFREAADDADGGQYRELFVEFAGRRSAVAQQLQAEVRRLGGTPEDDSSLLAAAHRTFLNLKDALTGHDDRAIINEVERGEDHIKHKFEEALRDDRISADTRAVIQQGYQSVKEGHDRVRALKHSFAG